MKLYCDPEVVNVSCPSCGAEKGAWCAPWMCHERRIRAWKKRTS